MNSKIVILPIAAVATFALAAATISASGASVGAKRYEVSFQPGSRGLEPRSIDSQELAAVVDLLVRQGERGELTFLVTAPVSKACMDRPDCPERARLQRRAESLVDALRRSWPAGVGQAAIDRLRWEATPSPSAIDARDEDRVRVLLRAKAVARRAACPGLIELLDPDLPGTVKNPDVAAWIGVGGDRAIPVGSSARLRLDSDPQGQQSVQIWLEAAGQATQLQPRHDAKLDQDVYGFDGPASSFWISLTSAANKSAMPAGLARSGGSDNRMGEIVSGFPPSAPSSSPPGPCSFQFQRWNS